MVVSANGDSMSHTITTPVRVESVSMHTTDAEPIHLHYLIHNSRHVATLYTYICRYDPLPSAHSLRPLERAEAISAALDLSLRSRLLKVSYKEAMCLGEKKTNQLNSTTDNAALHTIGRPRDDPGRVPAHVHAGDLGQVVREVRAQQVGRAPCARPCPPHLH